ncbi:MAG: hypothetical protein ACLFRI_05335 [Candidatus Izemoplasmataceae bacterium]
MKEKIIIEHNGEILFKGKLLTMPVKERAIKEKSIDLFDDDDPCIIHISFVVKHFAEKLLKLLHDNQGLIHAKAHQEMLDFLNIPIDDSTVIRIK